MRVAFFVGGFPVVSETFVLRQITGLMDLGHEVDIFADWAETTRLSHPEMEDYRLLARTTFMNMPTESSPWELPVTPLTGRTWVPGSAKSRRNIVRAVRMIPGVLRCIVRTPRLAFQALSPREYGYRAASLSALYRLDRLSGCPDRYSILHAHFGPVGDSFRFARQLWKTPFITSFHGYDFTTVPLQHGRHVYDRLFRVADAITVNSNYTLGRLVELGCPAEKLVKLPMAVDLRKISFRERVLAPGEPVRILSVGRLVPVKGHEYAVRAMDIVRRKHPGVRYDIIGEGPIRDRLVELVQKLGLTGIVKMHGALVGEKIRRLFDAAHLFVMPSIDIEGGAEGQGLALQEAQAAGLPVIATKSGGLPEGMLPGETGFLVQPKDVDGLAERLGYLLDHPETWARMGRRGRELVEEHYAASKLSRELAALYERTIAQFDRRDKTEGGRTR